MSAFYNILRFLVASIPLKSIAWQTPPQTWIRPLKVRRQRGRRWPPPPPLIDYRFQRRLQKAARGRRILCMSLKCIAMAVAGRYSPLVRVRLIAPSTTCNSGQAALSRVRSAARPAQGAVHRPRAAAIAGQKAFFQHEHVTLQHNCLHIPLLTCVQRGCLQAPKPTGDVPAADPLHAQSGRMRHVFCFFRKQPVFC